MNSASILIWILVIAGLGVMLILLNRTMISNRNRSRFDRSRRTKRQEAGRRSRTERNERGKEEGEREHEASSRTTNGSPPPPPPPPPPSDPDSPEPEKGAIHSVLPTQPQQPRDTPPDDKNEVLCTVYAPATMPSGGDYLVQVWLHLLEQAAVVEADAVMQDETASRRARTYLSAKLEKGDNVQIVLRCSDVRIDEPEQFAVWNGRPANTQFVVNVPSGLAKDAIFFTVEVFHDGIPVGKLKFRTATTSVSQAPQANAEVEADQYEHAFISYASADRDAVLARVQGLKAARKYRIFQDVLVLEQGDLWEPKLIEEINKCDVFFLFWSQNAKDSKWVKKEFILALERKQDNDNAPPRIHPIPIQEPVVKPWDDLKAELGKYHLNDQTLYFMSARRDTSG